MNERMALLPLAEYRETLERLRRLEKLCAIAADALDYATEEPKVCCNFNKLIAALRKAAE